MQDHEQITALAKLDGWTQIPKGLVGEGQWYQSDCWITQVNLPNYLTSYDAILPLTKKQKWEIKIKTAQHIDCDFFDELTWLCVAKVITATPREVCKSLLRAHGLWKE